MSKKVFSRYDAANGLKTEEDIAAFLEAATEEGESDPDFMARVLDVVARARTRLGRPKDWNGLFDAIKAVVSRPTFSAPASVTTPKTPARCQA